MKGTQCPAPVKFRVGAKVKPPGATRHFNITALQLKKVKVKAHTSQRPKRPVCHWYPFYTPGCRREIEWSKVPCLRKQCDWRGLNPGPPDPEFEVLTAWLLTPSQHVSSIPGAKVKPQGAPGSSRAQPCNNLFLLKEQGFSVFLLKL